MNILYLNHDFFEYDRAIETQLRRMGHRVLSYMYVRSPSNFEVTCYRGNESEAYKRACHNRQKSILKDIGGKKVKIEAVLVTAGHMLENNTLEVLKEWYPEAKFVWYLWDNTISLACYEMNRPFFDVLVSFDEIEATEKNMEFLPDFYIYEKRGVEKKWDLSYVGTYRRERENIVDQIIQKSKIDQKFIYLYQKEKFRVVDYMYSIFAKLIYRSVRVKDTYCFERILSYEETLNIMAQSRVVLDICNPSQSGLSMRPFEAMATHSKLVTTNENITRYDFYRSENIMVIDPENVTPIPEDFIRGKYEEVPNEILKKYSIRTWCEKMEIYMSKGENNYG